MYKGNLYTDAEFIEGKGYFIPELNTTIALSNHELVETLEPVELKPFDIEESSEEVNLEDVNLEDVTLDSADPDSEIQSAFLDLSPEAQAAVVAQVIKNPDAKDWDRDISDISKIPDNIINLFTNAVRDHTPKQTEPQTQRPLPKKASTEKGFIIPIFIIAAVIFVSQL